MNDNSPAKNSIIKSLESLVIRDLQTQFLSSKTGVFWLIFEPIGASLVYLFVFTVIARSINLGYEPYFIFLLSGLIPWFWITSTLKEAATVLNRNAILIKSIPLPLLIWPLKTVLVGTLRFIPIYLIFSSLITLIYEDIDLNIFFLFLAIVFNFIFLFAISILTMLLSYFISYFTKIVSLTLQFMRYLSPVLYAIDDVPSAYRFYLELNPFTLFFSLLRRAHWHFVDLDFRVILYSSVLCIILLIFGVLFTYIFQKRIKKSV